ncbi:MAG: sortase [Anaerolineae bacterium]|nr:sortase [Anaerolineae bacterium]
MPPVRLTPSRLILLAGSTLIVLGAGLLLIVLVAPEAAPALPVTLSLAVPDTPTPAFAGSPLPAPVEVLPPPERAALILPVMPVAAVTASFSETPRPSPSPTPTRDPRPPDASPTPAAPAPERLLIPRLGIDAPVVPVGWHAVQLDGALYGQWDVPDGGAVGWHETSARPGEPGNTVLNGHHNVAGQVFRNLVDLVPGDSLRALGGGQTFTYTVAQIMVLAEAGRPAGERLANAQWIMPSDDERLTLVTCWPASGNSHRLIVVAVPGGESTD